MKRLVSALLVVTTTAWGMAGCSGDDDDDSASSGGKSGSAGKSGGGSAGKAVLPDGGSPPEGGAAPSSGGSPSTGNLDCDPAAATTCQNAGDCPVVIDGSARTTAQTCGKGCLGSENANCARDCILDEVDITSDCATCYADFVNCTIAHCVGACLADANSDGCHTCQVEEGCRGTFDTCSGLPE